MRSKKVYPICSFCLQEIKGAVQDAGGKPSCFKCFLPYRQQQAWLEKHKADNEVIDWIRKDKFYCSACKERKNDNGVNFNNNGVACAKCGKKLSVFLFNILLNKRLKKIN